MSPARQRGRGAGRLAMEALIAAAEQAGLWKLLSRVFVENAASRSLLRSLGFREVGIYEKHARLDGSLARCRDRRAVDRGEYINRWYFIFNVCCFFPAGKKQHTRN